MQESLFYANQELKRADHLIFVSLKYTRTVDVIKNIIQRLILSYEHAFDVLLKKLKAEDRIATIPSLPRLKVECIQKGFHKHEDVQNYLKFYTLLRKIDRASFSRRQEYRRHVTMTAVIDDEEIEINIDIIGDYYAKTKEFINLVADIISKKEE